MNAQQIDDILSQAKIDKRGRIINKGRLNDMLHSLHLREVEILNIPVVTHSAYQLCPKCNGQGIVSKPPWVAGDVNEWTSSDASYICDLCNGTKVFPQHCG